MESKPDWPPVLVTFSEDMWDRGADTLTITARVRLGSTVVDFTGAAVRDGGGYQSFADDSGRATEEALLGLYMPDAPWQTYRAFGHDYVLYALPAADQASAVALEVQLPEGVWDDRADPGPDDPDRLLTTVVVLGHCALHLEARAVICPDLLTFAAYPEDADYIRTLAGRDGPFPLTAIDGRPYVLLAYPHGD